MPSPRHQTLNGHVYDDVLRLIFAGRFAPGERLDEQMIAVALGVSRTPLREAIAKLVKDGLVEHRPYRGNFVRSFTVQQASDLYEVRKSLESMAVRLTVPQLTPASIARLRAIVADVEAALGRGDMVGYAMAGQRFHETVSELSGNQTLVTLLRQLRGQIQVIRMMANRDPDVVESTAMERPSIVDAMAAGDIERAAHLMEEHIELVRRSITARLEDVETVSANAPAPIPVAPLWAERAPSTPAQQAVDLPF